MTRFGLRIPTFLVAVAFLATTIAAFAATPTADSPAPAPASGRNDFAIGTPGEAAYGPYTSPVAKVASTSTWSEVWLCVIFGPAEVQGYRVRCSGANYLDFAIADCCIPGDHWELKGKNWDVYPNTSVTTAPGPAVAYGQTSRVYNYGGTGWNPGNIDSYQECTYPHGVDVFGAGSYITFSSDGLCTVTPDVVRSRINRTP